MSVRVDERYWGLVGYGEGEMTLAPANGPTTTPDLSMRLGAGGAR